MAADRWGAEDIGDLTGRTALVTGANSGIGEATAAAMAVHGAHVVLACRDEGRALRTADRIVGRAPEATVEVLRLDLASQASVRDAAARLRDRHDRIDLLVNNAGVMATPFALSEDGFERQFATNHLGPFAFTGLVLDLLLTTMGSRVVTVSSWAHWIGALRLSSPEALQQLGGGYQRWFAYANSKLANLLFTGELDRRLRAAGTTTLAVAAHPGTARTELSANGPLLGRSGARARLGRLTSGLGQSAAAGALPSLYAATASGVGGGEYFGPRWLGQQFGPPARVRSSARSHRVDDAARLWALSEELTGVVYALGDPSTGAGAPGHGRPATP
ncbi:MAG: oxidoreductase [Acidimicrobiales bacterium]